MRIMDKFSRRDILKSLYGVWLLSHVPMSLAADLSSKEEFICQLESQDGSHSILFLNLTSYSHTLLKVPYVIHSILPIKNGREFILTSKGGYLFHANREKIISSLRSPPNTMFYGHSSFFEIDNKIYSSVIDFLDYNHVPLRKAIKINPDDINFGQGHLLEIDLQDLKIVNRFSTGGLFPHDQRKMNNSEIIILNSERSDISNWGGDLAIIDRNKKEVIKHYYLDNKYGYCPLAHMYGDEELAFVGISNEACVIFFDGKEMRKSVLERFIQEKYTEGEMLNAAFSADGSRLLAMNIDNQFLGLWDTRTGKLIKHTFFKAIVSVNLYKDQFLISIGDGLRFYDYDLNLKKEIRYDDLNIKNKWNCGPHTVII
jgi:WD40 repeat protein